MGTHLRKPICVRIVLLALALLASAGAPVRSATFTLGAHDLIVSDPHDSSGSGSILDINPATGQQQLMASVSHPTDLCFDLNGDIIVTDYGYTDLGKIVRINRTTFQTSVLSVGTNLARPIGVALAPDGQLLVVQHGANLVSGALLRIDPQTGAQTVLASGLGVCEGVALGIDGTIYVDNFQSPAWLYRVDPDTGGVTKVASLANAHGISRDLFRPDRMLVTNTSTLEGVNLQSGERTTLASGFTAASDVVQDSLGNAYVADYFGGRLTRVDLATGLVTTVASGGLLKTPRSMLPVPEPTLAMPLGLAAALSACRRRARVKRLTPK